MSWTKKRRIAELEEELRRLRADMWALSETSWTDKAAAQYEQYRQDLLIDALATENEKLRRRLAALGGDER